MTSTTNKAVEILKRHQAAMQARFCKLVVEMDEVLAQEAEGEEAYTSEVYELAEKLRVLSVALSLIPEEKEEPSAPRQPVAIATVVTVSPGPRLTLGDFLANYQTGSFEGTVDCLAAVMNISRQRAVGCVEHFHKKWTRDPDTLTKVLSLSHELHTSANGSILLLHELFGLTGLEAITAVNALRSQ